MSSPAPTESDSAQPNRIRGSRTTARCGDASVGAEALRRHDDEVDTDLAAVAALIGDRTRAAMLDALVAGDPLRASTLAGRAGVAPSTASEHLSRLLEGGLISCQASGRERRYRLASADVAEALEALSRVARPVRVTSLRAAGRGSALREARTCYDHLAGRVGVAVTEALVARRALILGDGSYELTRTGERLLVRIGADVASARARKRAFARACLDWSERRPHLAGALGAAVADALVANGWLARRPNDRGLIVTAAGAAGLRAELGLDLGALGV